MLIFDIYNIILTQLDKVWKMTVLFIFKCKTTPISPLPPSNGRRPHFFLLLIGFGKNKCTVTEDDAGGKSLGKLMPSWTKDEKSNIILNLPWLELILQKSWKTYADFLRHLTLSYTDNHSCHVRLKRMLTLLALTFSFHGHPMASAKFQRFLVYFAWHFVLYIQ